MSQELQLQVGVKILLKNKEGKFLMLSRGQKYPHMYGMRDIPGGRIDPGSELIDNLKREIYEETQLTEFENVKLVYAQDIFHKTKSKHIVRLTYIGDYVGDEEVILDMEENDMFEWLTLDEILKLEKLDPYVEEVVKSGLIT